MLIDNQRQHHLGINTQAASCRLHMRQQSHEKTLMNMKLIYMQFCRTHIMMNVTQPAMCQVRGTNTHKRKCCNWSQNLMVMMSELVMIL